MKFQLTIRRTTNLNDSMMIQQLAAYKKAKMMFTHLPDAEETLEVEAENREAARKMANRVTTLHFCGQQMDVLVDGTPALGNF